MFTEEMVAPCGLDCSLCGYAQDVKNPCPGCNGDSPNKLSFCSEWCEIIQCDKRKTGGYKYCDECPEFPCEPVQERETRYASDYPLQESPIRNFRMIRNLGMETFLARQREQWTCRSCGAPVSVHSGKCSNCGRSPR